MFFEKILLSPVFVSVDFTDIKAPQIKALPTFTGDQQALNYSKWFGELNPKIIDDTDLINAFSSSYLTTIQTQFFANPFDKMKRLAENKQIISYQHLEHYAKTHPETLVASLLKDKSTSSNFDERIKLLREKEEKRNTITVISPSYMHVVSKNPNEVYKKPENLNRLGVNKIYFFKQETISYSPSATDGVAPITLQQFQDSTNLKELLPAEKQLFETYLKM